MGLDFLSTPHGWVLWVVFNKYFGLGYLTPLRDIPEVYMGILSDRFPCESGGSYVRQFLFIPFNA